MADQDAPFSYLQALEARSRGVVSDIAQSQDVGEALWRGVGFRVGGHYCLTPMREIVEILAVPAVTRLPGVKPWVLGVANVRGRLLPIMDLSAFLGAEPVLLARSSSRALVVEIGDLYFGLVVNEVFGMQYFPMDSYRGDLQSGDAALDRFVAGAYVHENRAWSVFRPHRLTEEREFYNVAA